MTTFEQILQFLDGKKMKICAVCGLIISYLVVTNVIDGKLGTLIISILNIISGGAVYATDKLIGRRLGRSK